MPVAPPAFKYKCPECGYSKVVKPKSDVFPQAHMLGIFPKCKATMSKKELNIFDKMFRSCDYGY
jgi:DNA-directed RNA polymerase subunit RPC12/RpoP